MPRYACTKHVRAIRKASSTHSPVKVPKQRSPASPKPATPASKIYIPPPTFARSRALPWVGASLVAGLTAFYIAGIIVSARKPCQNAAISDLSQQKDVSGRYDNTADSFDSEVGLSEFLMGVNRMRKRLSKACKGHVLEVSCGTGRNLGYYDISREGGIQSLTFVDQSPQMVQVCRKKWDVLFGAADDTSNKNLKPGLIVRFLTGSALETMPPPPSAAKYDTIIQTMGLCSTPSPHALLLNMAKHLDTTNPEARILLLEHGRSYYPWMNNILDSSAEKHAEIHGCWFNRDIGSLVEDAAKRAGLEIVRERRHHVGTTWIFELRPSPGSVKEIPPVADEEVEPSTQRSWRNWLGLS